jgi:hypothetical protein
VKVNDQYPAAHAARLAGWLARYWFPVALIVLFLIALPGLVLFACNLFGLENALNAWLQDNFQLTYSISLPWWGVLLLLLVPFLILLLYFLKLKRKPVQVPSTFLWRKSIEDLHVNSLLQWLRQNVLLLLQLLIVVVCIYSVMSFRVHGRIGEGKYYILMIDNSASMSATDVAPNRLEWAKEQALKEIDAAAEDDVGMVIVFNSSAQTVQSRTSSRDLLRQAVKSIQPTERPTNIQQALGLAESLANPTRSTENEASKPPDQEPGTGVTYAKPEGAATAIHLYSDGRFRDVENFEVGNLNIHFHAAGREGAANVDNVGIIGCNAARHETDPTRVQVLAVVRNYRPVAVKNQAVELDYWVNGDHRLLADQVVELPPRVVEERQEPGKETTTIVEHTEDVPVTFDLKDLDESADVVVRVRLKDQHDQFPLDNQAWLVIGVVRKARVLIVGKRNDPLQSFYNAESTRKVARVTYLDPDKLGTDDYLKPALAGAYDLVIFDRCGPAREEDMPRANTFFIGYPPPPWKALGSAAKEGRAVEKLEHPHIKDWKKTNPVTRDLAALDVVGISQGFRMKLADLPSHTPRLLESDNDTALLLTLNRQGYTDLVLTFPIILNDKHDWNTNWPLFPSFPLFLRNVLYALGNVSDAATELPTQPGDVKTLRPDVSLEQVKEIQVIPPGGTPQTVKRGTRAEFDFKDTERVGVYQVMWDGVVQRSFAVNLLDAAESNLQPRTEIKIGGEVVKSGTTRGQPLDVWRWFVLAALSLLLAEWYIYNRRVYI